MAPKFKTTKKRTDFSKADDRGDFNIAYESLEPTHQSNAHQTSQQCYTQQQQQHQVQVQQQQPQQHQTSQAAPQTQQPVKQPQLHQQSKAPQNGTEPVKGAINSNNNDDTDNNNGISRDVTTTKAENNHKSTILSASVTGSLSVKEAMEPSGQSTVTPSPMPPPTHLSQTNATPKNKETFYSYKATPEASNFTWDAYLKILPGTPAPKEAFRQATILPKNRFTPKMYLEAKDPRNSSNWCLASVIFVEGLHLRLRLVGSDTMNDLYELIDSDNIRPVGSSPSDLLLAPTGFTGNIAAYPKFVENVLSRDSTIIAPPEYFPPTPPRPPRNLFAPHMRLEAVDLKNRDFILPATVAAVDGSKLHITFDGWKGSFDYKCDYFSRDIFPINWCREAKRAIQPPPNWQALLLGKMPPENARSSPIVSPSLNGARQNGRSMQVSPKKGRGRPKKSTVKDPFEKSSQKDKIKQNRPKSITPPTKLQMSSPTLPPSPISTEEFDTRTDLATSVHNVYRFQCQRTVPYDEWQKRKHEDQMPRETPDLKGVGDTSLNLSDTTSMASTLSLKDSTESSDQGSSAKRPKLDCMAAPVSKEFRKLVESKPKRLAEWRVEDVLDILKTESSLEKYIDTFKENEIDGKAFSLFNEKRQDLLISMGLKLGPVLKVLNLREQIAYHIDTSSTVLV